MLKSILVGLDGSPYSTAAVELGIRWAQQCEALLVGLGIIDEPTIRGPEPMPLGVGQFKIQRDEALLADARRKVEKFLQGFTSECSRAGVAFKLLEDVGLPADKIVLEAQRYDLVLLGRQTFFHVDSVEGTDETLFQVLKHSPRPVVTVPLALTAGKSILVAYDGSLQAARALQAFQATRLATGQQVHVLCIGANQLAAARRADRAAEFLRFHDVIVEAQGLVSDSPPGEVLLAQVRKLHPALVVMGAYGQPTWKEFFFGSVTRTMLKLSPAPLFLYH